MFLYKTFLLLFVIILLRMMMQTILSGRRFAKFWRNNFMLDQHKTFARATMFFTIAAIIAVEVGVTFTNREWDILFMVHLPFAILYGISIVLLNTILNGEKYDHHKKIAYLCAAAFVGAALTGIPLILRF